MLEAGVMEKLLTWGTVILTSVFSAFGFHYKKLLGRIDTMEKSVNLIELELARRGVKIQFLHDRLIAQDKKLDKILERLNDIQRR